MNSRSRQKKVTPLLVLRLGGRAALKMVDDYCFTHAAAISYYTIVSIFPLLLFCVSMLGFFLKTEDSQQEVMALAARFFPAGSLRFVRDNLSVTARLRGSLSLISLLGLLWAATSMFTAIVTAVNIAFGCAESSRFLASRAKSLLTVLGMSLFVTLSILVTTAAALLPRLAHILRDWAWGPWLWRVGGFTLQVVHWLVPPLLTALAFLWAYRFLPAARVRIREVWIAALLAASIWEVLKRVFVFYVTSMADYSRIYGPISAMFVLLLWTYLSSLILIWGAEFAALQSRRR